MIISSNKSESVYLAEDKSRVDEISKVYKLPFLQRFHLWFPTKIVTPIFVGAGVIAWLLLVLLKCIVRKNKSIN